jgi:hypothetical protein
VYKRAGWGLYSVEEIRLGLIECRRGQGGPNIVYKRSYNKFCSDSYVDDVKNICRGV